MRASASHSEAGPARPEAGQSIPAGLLPAPLSSRPAARTPVRYVPEAAAMPPPGRSRGLSRYRRARSRSRSHRRSAGGGRRRSARWAGRRGEEAGWTVRPLRDRSSLTKPKLKLGEWRRPATLRPPGVPKALRFGKEWDQKEAKSKKTSNQDALGHPSARQRQRSGLKRRKRT